MVMVGEYADTLRALGRYLDGVRATEITVIEERDQLGVVWRGPRPGREARYFAGAQLQALRMTARLHRGLEASTPQFTLAELLRTLGEVVDQAHGNAVIITETDGGFRLSALAEGKELTRTVSYSDLVERAHARYQQRLGLDR
jgi:hypothetical protein